MDLTSQLLNVQLYKKLDRRVSSRCVISFEEFLRARTRLGAWV